jgi:hypothetical protein
MQSINPAAGGTGVSANEQQEPVPPQRQLQPLIQHFRAAFEEVLQAPGARTLGQQGQGGAATSK